MLKKQFLSFVLVLLCSSQMLFSDSQMTLWYDQPAKFFEEALVLGNGRTGATVFGGVQSDQIYLNDATLWSGGPVDPDANPDVSNLIPLVREALAQEDYQTAERINQKIQGKFSESYSPLGTLFIDHKQQGQPTNYYRELDISKAVVSVKYDLDGTTYTREYLVSNPDKIMVVRLSANKPGALNFSVRFTSLLKFTTKADGDSLVAHGYAPYHAYPDYMWNDPEPIRFDQNKGTRFTTDIKVKNTGGQAAITDSGISVNNADEAVIYVSIATSFNGFDKDPVKNGLDSKAIAKNQLENAFPKNFHDIKASHINDYQTFFNRVKLDLNNSKAPNIPTNERLKRYTKGEIDNSLEVLYFQYGRYLLISCSRTEGVPANLQGIWNPHVRPPWSCNYTMNINAQENYWMAESANLPEMHQPFLTFIERLAVTGEHTAKAYYGIDKGWAAGHNSDIWATSNPVGDYGKLAPRSPCWNMAGVWAVTHLWEHFLFTGDMEFLREKGYPLMKGASEFCLAWMVKDKDGYLITSPSTSPEAHYITPDGFAGATHYGGTSDIAMIRECLDQTIKAAKALDIDANFRKTMQSALSQLLPYKIGAEGNLQEWYFDWKDQEVQHRHQSHLFGLYPGHQITPEKTPDLAQAAKKTLEIRGDKTTGWSKGWRINLWARLKDGNQTYKMFRELLTYVEPDDGKNINYNNGGGTYPNLFDAHPPFQIDGNFGGAAGVIEMLLQSNDQEVNLLPALPDAWNSGSVTGICARGGFELSIQWEAGKLTAVNILSKAGNNCSLIYNNKTISFPTEKGKSYSFNFTDFD